MKRHFYDLSGFSIQCNKIGNLQTLGVIPIVAGDSIELQIDGLFRLSQLRRELSIDALLDVFAFYVPHRHAYDTGGISLWTDFIKQGVDESITFPTFTLPTGITTVTRREVGDDERIETTYNTVSLSDIGFLGMEFAAGATLPLWLPFGYAAIHNRYFRHPLDFDDIRADGVTPASFVSNLFNLNNVSDYRQGFLGGSTSASHKSDRFRRGFRVCHLKAPWNAYMLELPAEDRQVPAGSTLDILDLRRVRARYKTELERAYFGQRYDDLIKRVWDSSVSIDADERPELLMRWRRFLSGRDVEGTDDAALGQTVGKSATAVDFRMPRKYFAEHGALWIMAVVRFPPIIFGEKHPMFKPQPTYKEIAGDPTVIMSEPPVDLDFADWNTNFTSSAKPGLVSSRSGEPSSNAKPVIPHSQHYRRGQHFIGPRYENLDGFPFLRPAEANMRSGSKFAPYINPDAYDDIFQSLQLDHWRCQLKLGIGAHRVIPPAIKSVMAGV